MSDQVQSTYPLDERLIPLLALISLRLRAFAVNEPRD